MKLLLISLSIFFFGSCSSLSNLNQVSESLLTLKGGQSDHQKWEEKLSFKRYSWYKGATLKYDLLVAKLDQDSKFYNWLGRSEKSQLSKCDSFYVVLTYAASLRSAKTSSSQLTQNFDVVGLKKITLPIFSSSLRNHYFTLQWNLKKHNIRGVCKTNNLSDIEVHVPNYETIKVFK